MKVLVVDDSATMRSVQKRCLVKLGISEDNIREAANGVAALDIFRSFECDVILTDWNMPEMNGLEFVLEVRKGNTTIPIVMITTESERARVLEAIQAGVSDYMVKPFTLEDLQHKLEKWLPIQTG